MHDLARMAEARQAEAKQELNGLLAERSKLLEAASEAAQEPSQVASSSICLTTSSLHRLILSMSHLEKI